MTSYIGEFAALATAFAWAAASILFRRLGSNVPPLCLNLYKGIVAIAMLLVTLAACGQLTTSIPLLGAALLFIGGVIGIGIGDTAFFAALNRIGERRTVLMSETLAPAVATLMALAALSEILSFYSLLGISLTVAGVCWVVVDRTTATQICLAHWKAGIFYGLISALCQGIGAVISRVLTQTGITPLQSCLIRLSGGLLILLFWMPLVRQKFFPESVRTVRIWRLVIGTTILSTYLGVFFQQVAFQHTSAGVAQTLIATSGLFVLPLVAMRGERIGFRAVAGALLAIVGIATLFADKNVDQQKGKAAFPFSDLIQRR